MRRSSCYVLSSFLLLAVCAKPTAQALQNSSPPVRLDTFEQLKLEAINSAAVKARIDSAARSEALADLQRRLPRLIEQAQGLQNELGRADLQSKLPADLEKRARELEQMARGIHKAVRQL